MHFMVVNLKLAENKSVKKSSFSGNWYLNCGMNKVPVNFANNSYRV